MLLFSIFLLIAVPLYGAMNGYVYYRITRAFPRPRGLKLALPPALFILFAAPFVGRLFDHDGHLWLARLINLTAYLWGAWVFWFCTAGLVLDLMARFRRRTRNARRELAIIVMVLVLATVWGLIEAAQPRIRSLTFVNSGMAPGDPPLTLVQVSDVHLSTFRGPKWSRALTDRIASLKPDIVVSTGDLIDSSLTNIGAQADDWAALRPPLGKYAIMGNHDYYTGLANAEAFHQRAGFRLLRGNGVEIGTNLVLFGVDDIAGRHMGAPCFTDESALALSGASNRFTILLKHQPVIAPATINAYDLQLSGHTHGGQMFPFHALVRVLYPHINGLYQIGTRSRLFVSRGAGTWGPPFRLFAPPELTVITLKPEPPAPDRLQNGAL